MYFNRTKKVLTPSKAREEANGPCFSNFYVYEGHVDVEIFTRYGDTVTRVSYCVSDTERFVQFCENNHYTYRQV